MPRHLISGVSRTDLEFHQCHFQLIGTASVTTAPCSRPGRSCSTCSVKYFDRRKTFVFQHLRKRRTVFQTAFSLAMHDCAPPIQHSVWQEAHTGDRKCARLDSLQDSF